MKFNFSSVICFRLFLVLMIIAVASTQLNRNSYFYQRQFSDPRTIRDYFAANEVRKLQLGAGAGNAVGWLNSDIQPEGGSIYLDATGEYPFDAGSFQYIYAENLIEHLPWEGGFKMLKECYRVLAPGGKVRVVTPDMVLLFNLINHPTRPDVQEFVKANLRLFKWPDTAVGPAYVFNKMIREWGHVFMYDHATLRKTFELAGFTSIRHMSLNDKTDPVFEKAEFRSRANFGDDVWLQNSWASMAFEATK